MIESVINAVRTLLKSDRIEGFLGLKQRHGQVGPHLFLKGDDLERMSLGDRQRPGDSRYPLNKQLIHLTRHYPEARFGVLVRGCDERGLRSLFTWNQLDPGKIIMVGIVCPPELAKACECPQPFPERYVEGDPAEGCSPDSVHRIDALDLSKRLNLWMAEFSKCIKCFGCRDICPVCFCKECSLESDGLVRTGDIPPENPVFHLIRAVHMAGRCIDCGLCSEACPADIPLRALYKKVADIVETEFSFRPGYETGRKSPLNLGGTA